MNDPVLICNNVSKNFFDNNILLDILLQINLQINQGEKVVIMGRSGSGKTTLLQLLGGLDTPSAGNIILCGKDLSNINEQEKASLRNNKIGFIYQMHHLLPEFTVLENVCMPLLIQKKSLKTATNLAIPLIQEVGLINRINHTPNKLSGGERQRVAIARALINNPSCVFADEPTGNLDTESASEVMDLINKLNQNHNTSVIMVTHDVNLTDKFDRIYRLENGSLIY
jgi:lipoprotein-releasing system ATP-binding protein